MKSSDLLNNFTYPGNRCGWPAGVGVGGLDLPFGPQCKVLIIGPKAGPPGPPFCV